MTDEQNKPVRSQDEHIIAIATLLSVLAESKPLTIDPDATMETAKNLIAEAEARGAAEQRRKDMESERPAAYCWTYGIGGKWRFAEKPPTATGAARKPKFVSPLYFRPAYFATLRARIAELEGALKEIIDTAGADCIHGLGPYIKIATAALTRTGTPS